MNDQLQRLKVEKNSVLRGELYFPRPPIFNKSSLGTLYMTYMSSLNVGTYYMLYFHNIHYYTDITCTMRAYNIMCER